MPLYTKGKQMLQHRQERTEAALKELGDILGNTTPLPSVAFADKDQVRTLLTKLDEEAFEAGYQQGGKDAAPSSPFVPIFPEDEGA